jgi:hypothetical protein
MPIVCVYLPCSVSVCAVKVVALLAAVCCRFFLVFELTLVDVRRKKPQKQNSIHFPDKNTSPTHQRTISDIRLARLTTVSDQQLTEATLQGAAAALSNNTGTSGSESIITIKQESLTNVDSLVGSYVDSTTFLPSPSQLINANLVQSIAMANEANGANDGKRH